MTQNLNQSIKPPQEVTRSTRGHHVTVPNQVTQDGEHHVTDREENERLRKLLIRREITIHHVIRKNQKRKDHVIEKDRDHVTETREAIAMRDEVITRDDRHLIKEEEDLQGHLQDHVIGRSRLQDQEVEIEDLEVEKEEIEVDQKVEIEIEKMTKSRKVLKSRKKSQNRKKNRNISITMMNSKIFIREFKIRKILKAQNRNQNQKTGPNQIRTGPNRI